MTAKERFMQQAEIKRQKHPVASVKLVSFSLAMAFLGLSIILIGVCHAPIEGWAGSVARLALAIVTLITLQGAVICSAIGVTSSRYVLHCISGASLAVSLALNISLAIYYMVFVV